MKPARTSVATAMVVIAVVAFCLSWNLAIDAGPGRSAVGFEALPYSNGFIFDYGLMGMFSVLSVSLTGLPSPDRRPFLVGFQVSGLLTMAAYCLVCCWWGEWLLPEPQSRHDWGLHRVGDLTNDALRAIGTSPEAVVRLLGANHCITLSWIVVLTLPQAALAYAGGVLVRSIYKYKAPHQSHQPDGGPPFYEPTSVKPPLKNPPSR